MNRIVMITKLDSSSFEVRAGLCLPSAISPGRSQHKGENGGGMTGCHPTAQPLQLLALGRQVSLGICDITASVISSLANGHVLCTLSNVTYKQIVGFAVEYPRTYLGFCVSFIQA